MSWQLRPAAQPLAAATDLTTMGDRQTAANGQFSATATGKLAAVLGNPAAATKPNPYQTW